MDDVTPKGQSYPIPSSRYGKKKKKKYFSCWAPI